MWWEKIAGIIVTIVKMIWGTSSTQDTTVVTPPADVEITDGKTDEERLNDCGL